MIQPAYGKRGAIPNVPRQAGNIPASSQRKRDRRKHLPEGWCIPRPLSQESAPTGIFRVQDSVRTRRATLWTLYRRAASTMIRPRPRRSK